MLMNPIALPLDLRPYAHMIKRIIVPGIKGDRDGGGYGVELIGFKIYGSPLKVGNNWKDIANHLQYAVKDVA